MKRKNEDIAKILREGSKGATTVFRSSGSIEEFIANAEEMAANERDPHLKAILKMSSKITPAVLLGFNDWIENGISDEIDVTDLGSTFMFEILVSAYTSAFMTLMASRCDPEAFGDIGRLFLMNLSGAVGESVGQAMAELTVPKGTKVQ